MNDASDVLSLEEFAREGSEEAFATIVQRHIALVHSVAMRHTLNPQLAEEITQAVFIILARKAGRLDRKTVLAGWLYQTARLTAANAQRAEMRRVRREQEAFMQSNVEESPADALWSEMSPQLDEAMGSLGAVERDALVLRYFQNKSVAEVGQSLGLAENTAQKRIGRALEKLRKFFAKRGVDSTTAIIAGTISSHSVRAVPAALGKSVTVLALARGAAASSSTLTLIKGALKVMAWTKAQTAIVTGAVVLLACGTTTVAVKEIRSHQPPAWQQTFDLALIDKLPPQVAILPSLPATISIGRHAAGRIRNGKMLGLGQNIPSIVMAAFGYQIHSAQLNFPSAIPHQKFDFIANLPAGQQEALQAELKRKFGLVGHLETNEVNCLLLQVKTKNATSLKRSVLPESGSELDDSYSAHHQVLWPLVDYLEEHLGTVVIDRTGLTGSFDIDFKWDKTPDGLKQVLLEQTGLELVPAKEPVEFLVVEDINHPVVGIGAGLAMDEQKQQLKITRVYPNSPAAESGLAAGGVIQKIDDVTVADKTLDECVRLIRGAEGTRVQLEVLLPDGNTNAVELTRRKIQL